METTNNNRHIVFAIYPHASGFGFVCMEHARKLIHYGAVRVSPICNRRILGRIDQLMTYLLPTLVILQDPEGKHARTGRRVSRLIEKIVAMAKAKNLNVMQHSRDQIREVFAQFGAVSKYDIAQALLTEFKELEEYTPKKRSLWASEHHHMPIFDALSLALTWYYLND